MGNPFPLNLITFNKGVMIMTDVILSSLVRELRLRADGITNNLTTLTAVGLQQADIDAGQALATQLEQLDSEQEALKAALKTKTAALNATKKEATKWRTRVTKLIKVGLSEQQEKWVEFGISAKR